jgi:hypothetical protein
VVVNDAVLDAAMGGDNMKDCWSFSVMSYTTCGQFPSAIIFFFAMLRVLRASFHLRFVHFYFLFFFLVMLPAD